MDGPGDEDPPLPVDDDSSVIIRDRGCVGDWLIGGDGGCLGVWLEAPES